jgi:outer membrane protein TolC
MTVCGLATALAGVVSCGRGMSGIDAETNRLLAERSATLGKDAASPERSFGDIGKEERSWTATTIPTDNPDAADLRYDVASETRDVAARLEGYQKSEGQPSPGQSLKNLTLTDALRTGQKSASEYLAAEEAYILAAIQLMTTRHLWSPRVFNDTTVGLAGQGNDGDFQHALSIINELRVTKRLPFGGSVEASWITQATDQLREQVTSGYVQSSRLALSGTVPLLRGAGDIAREDLIQAERNLIYQARNFEQFRRDFLIAIAADYFDLLQSSAEIANQEEALKNLRTIELEKQALLDAGRIAEFERNEAANQVLSSVAQLAAQKESYLLQLERFKIRLGLVSRAAVVLNESVLDIPEPEVSLGRAVELALTYRLDLQNQRDQVDDARRAVANAKNQTLPDLNVTASVGVPTNPRKDVGRLGFEPDDLNYQAGVTLGLPLDREIERLGVRSATIALQARERDYIRSRDEAAVGVRQAVRNVDLARFQFTLAERQVEINQRRVRETELKRDEVTTRIRVDAANELQQSQNNRDRARTNLRNTILRYLRDSGQLRVAKDGTFLPLPGMEAAAEVPPPPAGE